MALHLGRFKQNRSRLVTLQSTTCVSPQTAIEVGAVEDAIRSSDHHSIEVCQVLDCLREMVPVLDWDNPTVWVQHVEQAGSGAIPITSMHIPRGPRECAAVRDARQTPGLSRKAVALLQRVLALEVDLAVADAMMGHDGEY